MIGIAHGLGIPLAPVAGAALSGCYVGDKLSPLSDTTNLAPAVAGATTYEHIAHVLHHDTRHDPLLYRFLLRLLQRYR